MSRVMLKQTLIQGSKWTFGKKPEKCVSLLAGHGQPLFWNDINSERSLTFYGQCHTKTRNDRTPPANPSFGMTKTKIFRHVSA